MKKLLIGMFFILMVSVLLNISPSVYAENYSSYKSIVFDDEEFVLLDSWSRELEYSYYDKIPKKKRMLGWVVYYTGKKKHFTFTSDTLRKITNNGTTTIKQTLSFESKYEENIQRKVKGDLKLNGSGEYKKFKFGLEGKLEYELDQSTKTTKTEKESFNIEVAPGDELVISILGEGYMFQGVARQYILFIAALQGGFEYAIITDEYYSIETNILEY